MKKILNLTTLFLLLIGVSSCGTTPQKAESTRSHQELLSDFIDLRHGMFICFNIMSYGAKWSEADYPIDTFNPTQLDCEQWAKAAVSANMTFGLLTTKHHEGFALWDSSVSDYDVASSPYKKDIVRQYVDAFRKHNLKVGLYYSILDSTNDVNSGTVSKERLDFVKSEITELLTNYGKVDYFVVDGWYWRMGHREVPFTEIRELIYSLQPECLITDHTHLQAQYHVDIPYFEGPFGAFPPEDNTMASALGHCPAKGNGWFWSEKTIGGMRDSAKDVVSILEKCEARYCNFMLNCMPNRDGLLDPAYITLLKEIGELWSADTKRPPLPEQPKPMRYEVMVKEATATSGEPFNLIAGRQMGVDHTNWISDERKEQSITLDLGDEYANINMMNFVQAHNCKPAPERSLTDGNVTHAKLYTSVDGRTFTQVYEGRWSADAKMRSMIFDTTPARYLRLDILEYNGDKAIIIETQVGNHSEVIKTL